MKLKKERIHYLFKTYLLNKAYSPITIKRYMREIAVFFTWLNEHKNKHDIREVIKSDIMSYQLYLQHAIRNGKQQFSNGTQKGMMQSLKSLFRFLSRNEYIISNPFDNLDIEIITIKKLRTGISEKEINVFLDSIPVKHPLDVRDRALFELMYGTGLRVSEVENLDLVDVDLKSGRLLVRQGKGNKDRIVPLGNNVMKYIELYLKKGRDYFLEFVKDKSMKEALFLTCKGRRIGTAAIRERLQKRFSEITGDDKKVCPHMIRHSFATHVLDHGAGVKEVKDILGHSCIESTVGYTHFSISSMKRILKQYHPRENELYTDLTEEELARIEGILID